jgi:hypothetical protein
MAEPLAQISRIRFSPDGRSIATGSSQGKVVIFNAFPWKESEYPGEKSMPFEERVEMYKRAYWKDRIAASGEQEEGGKENGKR